MSMISNGMIAFSMSADAFAASLSKGVGLKKPTLRYAMRIGMIFGMVETITPLIGWGIGVIASSMIASIDHWVAFVILACIGSKMIYESFGQEEVVRKESHNISTLILTAIGTSMDAMAVGATLALLDINIWMMAAMIGCATFMMSTIGVMTGHYLGVKAGKMAELLGGICLIGIGTKILLEHLGML